MTSTALVKMFSMNFFAIQIAGLGEILSTHISEVPIQVTI